MPFESGRELAIPLVNVGDTSQETFTFAGNISAGPGADYDTLPAVPSQNIIAYCAGYLFQPVPLAEGLESLMIPRVLTFGTFLLEFSRHVSIIETPTEFLVFQSVSLQYAFRRSDYAALGSTLIRFSTANGASVTRQLTFNIAMTAIFG